MDDGRVETTPRASMRRSRWSLFSRCAVLFLATIVLGSLDEPRPDEPWIDPIYLFGCGLSWRKWRNASAGWELIKCLRSSGQAARIAAAFLSQAENAEVQEINSGRKPPKNSGPVAPASRRRWRL
jgi:hypothetical protein